MIDIINFSNQLQNIIYENRLLKEENEILKREKQELNEFILEFNRNAHENIRDIFSITMDNIISLKEV